MAAFTQVNTEILTVTVQRRRGQVFVPILEMRKQRDSSTRGAAAKNQSVPVGRPELFCAAHPGWREPFFGWNHLTLGSLPNPEGVVCTLVRGKL